MVNVPISFPAPGLVGVLEDCAIVLEDTVTVCTLCANPNQDASKALLPKSRCYAKEDSLPDSR